MYEIYVRTLLVEGHGLPCWEPRPLYPQTQPLGVVPGDVGTYTAESGFRRSFNLFDDAAIIHGITQQTHAILASEYIDPRQKLSHKPDIFKKGDVYAHGSSMEPPSP